MDMNERSLRKIKIGMGGPKSGIPRDEEFEITAASEVTAIMALSNGLDDLKQRLGRIIVGYDGDSMPVLASQLNSPGAMALLLKDALKPNLVQTLENSPAIVHGGPFANIAHGAPSIVAIKLSLKLADYVFVEPGFGADLGAEKFFNIVCRQGELVPDAVVIVASLRALKMHGGVDVDKLERKDSKSLEKGLVNLEKHVENLSKFGLPIVIAINRFENDSNEELELMKNVCERLAPSEISDIFCHGGEGGEDLAERLLKILDNNESNFHFLYDLNMSVEEKVNIIAKEIYGAEGVNFTSEAEDSIRNIKKMGLDNLPICVAKTQYSFSTDPSLAENGTLRQTASYPVGLDRKERS